MRTVRLLDNGETKTTTIVVLLGSTTDGDRLVLETIMGDAPLSIIVPLRALPDRMRTYKLSTEQAALEAIIKEHATRMLALGPDPESADVRIADMGGLRKDVEIVGA